MKSVGVAVVCGTASRIAPPSRCSAPSTFCVAKKRSATRPTKKGATMAAIGFTVNGQCVSVSIPWLVMYTAIVVYQAPQTKNCRNIIRLRRVVDDWGMVRGGLRGGGAAGRRALRAPGAAGHRGHEVVQPLRRELQRAALLGALVG